MVQINDHHETLGSGSALPVTTSGALALWRVSVRTIDEFGRRFLSPTWSDNLKPLMKEDYSLAEILKIRERKLSRKGAIMDYDLVHPSPFLSLFDDNLTKDPRIAEKRTTFITPPRSLLYYPHISG